MKGGLYSLLPIEILIEIFDNHCLSMKDLANFRLSSKTIMNLVDQVHHYKNILNKLHFKSNNQQRESNESVSYTYETIFEYRNLMYPLNAFTFTFMVSEESLYVNFLILATCIKEGKQINLNIHEYLESLDIFSPFQIEIKKNNNNLLCIFKINIFGKFEYTFEATQCIQAFTQMSYLGEKELIKSNTSNTSIQELYKPDIDYYLSKVIH